MPPRRLEGFQDSYTLFFNGFNRRRQFFRVGENGQHSKQQCTFNHIFPFNIKAKRVLMMMPITDIGKSWRARIALSVLG
ncbi:hypothetical protein SEES7308_15595 [Salmonella enterica subsp. enterica serovar Stanley str. ATCC 7308]|nr:hypothetical protein SEES7308_15595 [Salmonella enterica subsp. enterica serovar Stanley str. ATCC 7308]